MRDTLPVGFSGHHLPAIFIRGWSQCLRASLHVEGRSRRQLFDGRNVRQLVALVVALSRHESRRVFLIFLNCIFGKDLRLLVQGQLGLRLILGLGVDPVAHNGVVVQARNPPRLIWNLAISRLALAGVRSRLLVLWLRQPLLEIPAINVVLSLLEVAEPEDHHLALHLELVHELHVVFAAAVLDLGVDLVLDVVPLQRHVHDHLHLVSRRFVAQDHFLLHRLLAH